jgi:hypothetical protein
LSNIGNDKFIDYFDNATLPTHSSSNPNKKSPQYYVPESILVLNPMSSNQHFTSKPTNSSFVPIVFQLSDILKNPCKISNGFPEPSIFEYSMMWAVRLEIRGGQHWLCSKKILSKRSSPNLFFNFLQIHIDYVFQSQIQRLCNESVR